jgi:hypothetical protein
MDLLDLLRAGLDRGRPSYLSRALAHRGEDLLRRISVVLRRGSSFPRDWVDAVRARVPVFLEQTLAEAVEHASRLGDDLCAARIIDAGDARGRGELARHADAEAVAFADRALERDWQRGVLGLGDAAA